MGAESRPEARGLRARGRHSGESPGFSFCSPCTPDGALEKPATRTHHQVGQEQPGDQEKDSHTEPRTFFHTCPNPAKRRGKNQPKATVSHCAGSETSTPPGDSEAGVVPPGPVTRQQREKGKQAVPVSTLSPTPALAGQFF